MSFKKHFIHFLFSGITFALLMSAFDYVDKKPFDITKFLLLAVVFGLGSVLIDFLLNRKARKTE